MTSQETTLLNAVKGVMPTNFINESSDTKILAFVDLVVSEINWNMPYTNYDRNTLPIELLQIVVLGTNVYATLFKQMEATLQDFDYNDNGISVRVDQVGKINTQHVNILKLYQQQVDWAKKVLLLRNGGQGLGTPKYQSSIGQFLKMSLGSSFSWGS